MGTAYKALLPYQTFRTKTRDLALAVGSEKLWKVFCPVIGRPELADDPRYRTNADRARNRDTLIAALQEVFLTRSYEEWEPLLLADGHPDGRDQQHRPGRRASRRSQARGALVEMDHPRAGKVRMVGAPVQALRDAGLGAHAGSDARRAHRRGAGSAPGPRRRGDRRPSRSGSHRPESLKRAEKCQL